MITLELKDDIEELLNDSLYRLVKFIGYEPTGQFIVVCFSIGDQSHQPLKISDDEDEFGSNLGLDAPQSVVHVDFIARKVNLLCKLSPTLDCFGASLNFNHSILSITTSRILYKMVNNGASLVVTNNGGGNNINGGNNFNNGNNNDSSSALISSHHPQQQQQNIPGVPSVNSYENRNLRNVNETYQIVSNLKSFLTKENKDGNHSQYHHHGHGLSPMAPSISNPALLAQQERVVLYESYFVELKSKTKNKSPQTLFKKSETPQTIQFIHSNRLKNGKNYFLSISSGSIQIFSFSTDSKTGAMKGPPKEVKTITSKSHPDGDSSSSFSSLFSSKSSSANEDNEVIWYQWDVDTHFLYFIVRSPFPSANSFGKMNLVLYCWNIDLDGLQLVYKYPILNHLPPDLLHFGSRDFPVSSMIDPLVFSGRTNTLTPNYFNSFFLETSTIRMQIVKLENGHDILCMQYRDLRPSTQENVMNVYIYHFKEKKCLKLNLQSKHYLLISKYKKNNLMLFLPNKYLQLIKGSTLSTIFQFNKNQFNLSLHNEMPIKLDEPHLLPVFGHVEGHFINIRNGCVFNFDLMITYLTSSHWLQIPDLVNDQFIPVLEFILFNYPKDVALQFLSYLFYSMEKSPHKKNIQFAKLISLGMKEYIIGACYQQSIRKGMDPEFISLLPNNRHDFYDSILGVVSSLIKKKQLNLGSITLDGSSTPSRSGGGANSTPQSPSPSSPQQTLILNNETYEEYTKFAIFYGKSIKNWNAKKWASEFNTILTEEMELLSETIMSQQNEEEKYFFMLMECFYTSLLLDYRLPPPAEFNFNFVISGFKALERDIFYQYCDRGVFEINNQVINALCQADLLTKECKEDIQCLNYLLRISVDPVNISYVINHLEGIEDCQFAISNYYHTIFSINADDWSDHDLNQNSLKKILKKKQKKHNQERHEREHHSFIRDQILNIMGTRASFNSSSFNSSYGYNSEYGSSFVGGGGEEAPRKMEVGGGGAAADIDSEENNSECSDVSIISLSATHTIFAPLVSYLLSIQKLSHTASTIVGGTGDKSPLSEQQQQPSTPKQKMVEDDETSFVGTTPTALFSSNPFNPPNGLWAKERDYIQSVACEHYLKKHFF